MLATIKFNDEAHAILVQALLALLDTTIVGEFTNDGFPANCVIVGVDEIEGLTICEADEFGSPIRNSTWLVPWEQVVAVTVV